MVIVLAGGVAIYSLPLAQYPEITPPTIQVLCSYPGANAQVVADTVAAPIEQQVNGVENMLYMSSQCTNDGAYTLTCTFKLGTDLQLALVQVQNRVQLAMPQLPDQVRQQGVNIKKRTPNILLVVNLFSPDDRYDDLYLSNYATINVRDELMRLNGVSDVLMLGQRDYSIRAWLDPEQLATRNLTAGEVVNAVREENKQVVVGQLRQPPGSKESQFQPTLCALGRLMTPEQFGNIIVKTGRTDPDSPVTPVVRLRDVSRIELGAQQYDQACTMDGRPSAGLGIFQTPTANALDTADGVREKMEELKERFPKGLEYEINYDTTPFISESIDEVVKTMRDAVILVALVVLLFLQNWRAAIIPLAAMPVAIVGTFAVMLAFGFSLNNLTLFGLVLAIGIVVDDAIVVVENVERWLAEGLAPREAAIKAMDEVTGPVVAVALVLCAVFVPCAFISGITGQFFRQFALTIAVSTVISAFNSVTLSPALAAVLLKPHGARHDWLTVAMDASLGWFFRLFNWGFERSTNLYARCVGLLLRGSALALLLYVGLLVLTWWGFSRIPAGFIPDQDKGYLLINIQLPEAASAARTREVIGRLGRLARSIDGVEHTVGVAGQSILLSANAPSFGSMFLILDPFSERHEPELYDMAIAKKLERLCYEEIPDAVISIFGAPPVDGLGTASGFKLMIEDRGPLGSKILQESTEALIQRANRDPRFAGLFTMFRSDTPQIYADIDRVKAKSMGVNVSDVFNTLQVYMGSLYVNNFNEFGRSWQVNLQAQGRYRRDADQVGQLKVRNVAGEMVPLNTLTRLEDINGPVMVTRYNMFPAAAINGNMAPGTSSSQAIQLMEEYAAQVLPEKITYEWTELTFMQILAGNTAAIVFTLAVVLVFLVLAAQYESWSLPLAVILVVPMCLLCSIAGVALAKMDVNIFTQIGFVVLVGLASKNAILIVEFARQRREAGDSGREATLEACRLRLRPIIMTSLAFILGVVPLMLAEGAGAEMRRTLGIAVFSGMLGVTLFGIFLTPVFFYVIDRLGGTRLFASPLMQKTSSIVLEVLTLGMLSGWIKSFVKTSEAKRSSPETEECEKEPP